MTIKRILFLCLFFVSYPALAHAQHTQPRTADPSNVPIGSTQYAGSLSDYTAALANSSVQYVILLQPITLTAPSTHTKPVYQDPGAIITTSATYTLTINVDAPHGNWQRFAGGHVIFGPGMTAPPNACWFGAKGDDTSFAAKYDSGPAIQAAITAALAIGVETYLPQGRYYSSVQLNMQGPDTFPWPSTLSGAMPVQDWGGWNSMTLSGKGTELHYTGSVWPAITTGQGRTVTIKNLALTGPGRTTAGSIGIGIRGGNTGFHVLDCLINGFETGIKTGYDADKNGDINTFERVRFKEVYNSIWFSKSQNYINTILNCSLCGRVGVRSDGPSYNVIGGEYLPTYVQPNTESVWETTVASVSGQNVTLTNGSNLAAGMFMVVKGNATAVGSFTQPWHCPLGIISSVSGNVATISGFTGRISNNAVVQYGYPSIAFWTNHGANISGIHIEGGGASSDGNTYDPILLYNSGIDAVTIAGIYYNQAAGTNCNYNKLWPLIYTQGPTNIVDNHISRVYGKVQVGSSFMVRLKNNIWPWEPIYIGSTGYYPSGYTLERDNEKYVWAWGSPNTYSNREHVILDKYVGLQPLQAPQRMNHVEYYDNSNPPKIGVAGEFVQATGRNAMNFLGWKQTYDDTLASEMRLATITATGTITAGSAALVVRDVSPFWPYQGIVVVGAGAAGSNLAARIEFIDGGTNTLYLNTAARTAVSSAAITSTSPAYKKFGRQGDFGTAAPSSGAWATSDIVWNTSPSAGGYVGWVCTSGGTPGTWKGFGLIQSP